MAKKKVQEEVVIARKKPEKKPKIVVFIGYSCSGKDKCLNLFNEISRYPIVVSTTSRPIREGEIEGKDYFFISKKKFQLGIVEKQFVEFREYHTLLNGKPDVWYYGVNKNQVGKGNRVAVLDPVGLEAIEAFYGKENVLSVWVDCPTKLRKQRNISRGDYDEIEFNRREKADKRTFKGIKKKCDCVIYNDFTSEEALKEDVLRLFELSDFVFAEKRMNQKSKLEIKRKKK